MLSLSSRSCIRLNYYSLCNFDWCIMPSWRYSKEFINVHKLQTMVRWLRICKFYQIDTIFTVIDSLSCGVFVWRTACYELRVTTMAGGMASGNRVDNCGSWTGDYGIGVLAVKVGLLLVVVVFYLFIYYICIKTYNGS